MPMRIVGITGGIASGKTTVTKMFAELGALTFSADDDARAVLEAGSPLLQDVLQAFPDAAAPDGNLDRAVLASIVFAKPRERKRLEAMMHPPIIERMRAKITAARTAYPQRTLVYEVPLLFESGLEPLFGMIITALASSADQAMRLQIRERQAGRSELSQAALAERLSAQLSPEAKALRSHYVIETSSGLEATRKQVARIWNLIHDSPIILPRRTPQDESVP